MPDNKIKDLLIEDIKNINLGVYLLNEQVKKEVNENEISIELKKKLALLNNSMELVSKKYILSHLEGRKENKKSEIRVANDKIRELENKLGKNTSISDIPKLLNYLKSEINEKLENLGLYCSPKIIFNEYGINIKLKYIKLKQDDIRYSQNEDDLENIKLKNIRYKESFYKNFDVSDTEKNKEIKIKMTIKNIEVIQKILSNINGYSFELESISNDKFNCDFDLIDNMKFYLSINNFSFPKMYYGD